MEEIKLEPGWLKEMMEEAIREVETWPECMQPMRHINDSLIRPPDEEELARLREARSG